VCRIWKIQLADSLTLLAAISSCFIFCLCYVLCTSHFLQDVPGLIAGAAQGVGLGHAFLRHVERCHVILHLVDATSIEPLADFHMLNREMVNYGSGQLGKMPQVVVVNKVDALRSSRSSNTGTGGEDWESGLQTKMTREELEQDLQQAMSHTRLLWISAKEKEGVDELMARLAVFVKKVKEQNSA
jgi:GTPase